MVVKKSDGPTAAARVGRTEGHQKARTAASPPHHAAWLGWVILAALVVVTVTLAIAAVSLGGS
jgi:hypothetical protein